MFGASKFVARKARRYFWRVKICGAYGASKSLARQNVWRVRRVKLFGAYGALARLARHLVHSLGSLSIQII